MSERASKKRRIDNVFDTKEYKLDITKAELLFYCRRLWDDDDYGYIQFRTRLFGRVQLTLWPYRDGRHERCMCMKLFDFDGLCIDWDTEELFTADVTEWSWTNCKLPTTKHSNPELVRPWMLKILPIKFPTVELLIDHLKQAKKLSDVPIEMLDLVASYSL